MKSTLKFATAFFIISWAIFTIQLYRGYRQMEINLEVYRTEIQSLKEKKADKADNEIHFIWNDDEESIPKDGSLITLEYTDENTVYIGPYDKNATAE